MSVNKSFKRSVVLGIIASSLLILAGIISLIMFGIHSTYIIIFDEIVQLVGGVDVVEIYFNSPIDVILSVSYVVVLFLNLVQVIVGILGLVFSIVVSKDVHYSVIKFHKKRGLHIAYIIIMGVCGETTATSLLTLTDLSIIITAASVLFSLALLFGIIGVVVTGKQYSSLMNYNKRAQYQNEFQAKLNADNPVVEEVKEESEVTQEVIEEKVEIEQVEPTPVNEKVPLSQEEVENIYSLLAKLEREYKSNQIDEESYKRMKDTIIDNLRK